MPYPRKLQALLDTFAMFPDVADRSNMLISYADRFREVPPEVATRPFANEHLAALRIEAYIRPFQPDGTLKPHCRGKPVRHFGQGPGGHH
jgi:hypothetical protein